MTRSKFTPPLKNGINQYSLQEEFLMIKPNVENALWMAAGAVMLILLYLVVFHFYQNQNPATQLAFKASRVDSVSRMRLALASASEAEKSAVLAIDTEKPEFTSFITPYYSIARGDILYWEAKDNQKVVKYKVYFNGKIKTVKNARFTVPASTIPGTYSIKVKAYDEAGNSVNKSTWVRVR
jgi:hypothetical protein